MSLPRLVTFATDADVLAAVAVVVEHGLAVKDAVLPGRDDGAGLPLGGVEDVVDRLADGCRIEFGEQLRQPPLAEMGGADHRREVAAEVARVADVQRDHVEHVVAQPSRLVELDRRDAQAFLLDLRRHRVVGAVRRAADVALVRAHDGPEQPLAVDRTPARTRSRPADGCRRDRDRSSGSRRPAARRGCAPRPRASPTAARRHAPECGRPARSAAPACRRSPARNRGWS